MVLLNIRKEKYGKTLTVTNRKIKESSQNFHLALLKVLIAWKWLKVLLTNQLEIKNKFKSYLKILTENLLLLSNILQC